PSLPMKPIRSVRTGMTGCVRVVCVCGEPVPLGIVRSEDSDSHASGVSPSWASPPFAEVCRLRFARFGPTVAPVLSCGVAVELVETLAPGPTIAQLAHPRSPLDSVPHRHSELGKHQSKKISGHSGLPTALRAPIHSSEPLFRTWVLGAPVRRRDGTRRCLR